MAAYSAKRDGSRLFKRSVNRNMTILSRSAKVLRSPSRSCGI